MKMLDLFAGVGGFSLAGRWLGMETVAFCEIDEWCQRVLRKHWPNAYIHGDIATFRKGVVPDEFFDGTIDLVCGGFPCQPYSVAGKQRGSEDDRALWPEMARVIAAVRPTYILVENSPNIRTMVLDDIYDDLESNGYAVRAAIVPAGAVEAPFHRERMYVFAHLDRARELPGTEGGDQQGNRRRDVLPHAGGIGIEGINQRIHRISASSERNDHAVAPVTGVHSDTHCTGRQEQRRPVTGGEELAACELTCWRSPQSGMDGMVSGIPDRMDGPHRGWDWSEPIARRVTVGDQKVPDRGKRVAAMGNAVIPPLIYELFRVMIGEAA